MCKVNEGFEVAATAVVLSSLYTLVYIMGRDILDFIHISCYETMLNFVIVLDLLKPQ